MKTTAKKILTDAAVLYTVGTLLLYLIALIVDPDGLSMVVGLLNAILIFPFCLCFSMARALVRSKRIGPAAGRLSHFGIVILAFFLFLWLPSGTIKTFPSAMITLLLVSLLYWLGFLIAKGTVHRYRSIKEED